MTEHDSQWGSLTDQTWETLELLEQMYHEWEPASTKGTAGDWGNLGLLYQSRGNLEKAEEFYRHALQNHEAGENQEGMAADYCNLGLLYQSRGNVEQATVCWKKSLSLYRAMKHPNAEVIQNLLHQLSYC